MTATTVVQPSSLGRIYCTHENHGGLKGHKGVGCFPCKWCHSSIVITELADHLESCVLNPKNRDKKTRA